MRAELAPFVVVIEPPIGYFLHFAVSTLTVPLVVAPPGPVPLSVMSIVTLPSSGRCVAFTVVAPLVIGYARPLIVNAVVAISPVNDNEPPAVAKAPPAITDKPPAETATAPAAVTRGGWAVQVGAFGSATAAQRLVTDLQGAGYRAYVSPVTRSGKTLHRVRVGPEAGRDDANRLAERLKGRGLPTAVVAND